MHMHMVGWGLMALSAQTGDTMPQGLIKVGWKCLLLSIDSRIR